MIKNCQKVAWQKITKNTRFQKKNLVKKIEKCQHWALFFSKISWLIWHDVQIFVDDNIQISVQCKSNSQKRVDFAAEHSEQILTRTNTVRYNSCDLDNNNWMLAAVHYALAAKSTLFWPLLLHCTLICILSSTKICISCQMNQCAFVTKWQP